MPFDHLRRRHLLQAALGSGAFALLPQLARGQAPTQGPRQPFSFDLLRRRAEELARTPYVPEPVMDPEILDQVDYDRHNQIRFRPERSLWRGQHPTSPVQPFFPGLYFRNPVRLHTVEDGMAAEVPFSLDLFDIPPGNPARRLTRTTGFAGFRVQDARTGIDWMAFLGASYWRTSGYSGQFGLSARGLAIDTAIANGPEEFPLFTHFWLEPASHGDLTAYALLNSPRATGAYRIESRRGEGVRQDITATIFLRDGVERLGIAPLTSMFWFGKNTPHVAPDWRPEVHDSDGLEILTGTGERIWRPLNNPPRTMVNSFAAPSVRGFGLMQRERDFAQYQDDGVFYDRRASAWITPRGDWGEGAVVLTELRTDDEIHDNIVAFWQPALPATAGQRHDIAYRLDWVRGTPSPGTGARFIATRLGAGGVPGQPRPRDVVKIVCDFAGPNLAGLDREDGLSLSVAAGPAQVSNSAVYPVVGTDYWRALFDIALPPGHDAPIDLRAFVARGEEAMTETLILQLFPAQMRTLLARTP